jgi:hypothetical protein
MSSLTEILASIESRLADLHSEISSLQAARAELRNGHSAPARAAAPRPTTRRRGSARTKPAKARAGQSVAAPPADASGTPAAAVPAPDPGSRRAASASKRRAASASKRRPRTATRRARGGKATKDLVAGSLEAMLRESGNGLSAAAIARSAKARDGQVRDLLRELASAGRVRQSGARRASLWRLVTDEERIAERAAELAARSAAKS